MIWLFICCFFFLKGDVSAYTVWSKCGDDQQKKSYKSVQLACDALSSCNNIATITLSSAEGAETNENIGGKVNCKALNKNKVIIQGDSNTVIGDTTWTLTTESGFTGESSFELRNISFSRCDNGPCLSIISGPENHQFYVNMTNMSFYDISGYSAVHIENDNTLVEVFDSKFNDINARTGAALHVRGGSIRVANNIFYNCIALGYDTQLYFHDGPVSQGGAIFAQEGTKLIHIDSGNIFTNCFSGQGGAIFSNSQKFILGSKNRFEQCGAAVWGGAIACNNISSIGIANTVSRCSANLGGAIILDDDSNIDVSKIKFSENVAVECKDVGVLNENADDMPTAVCK